MQVVIVNNNNTNNINVPLW